MTVPSGIELALEEVADEDAAAAALVADGAVVITRGVETRPGADVAEAVPAVGLKRKLEVALGSFVAVASPLKPDALGGGERVFCRP